jgi:hypothetical protein
MSNRAQRRAMRKIRGELKDSCVFCEAIGIMDHIAEIIVPTLDGDAQASMRTELIRARQSFSTMENIAHERQVRYHP